jgi:hypothetical protein
MAKFAKKGLRPVWMNEDGAITYTKPCGSGWVKLVPEPEFGAIYGNQDDLAVKFSAEINNGTKFDPVAVLEMAEALYKAEAEGRHDV